MKSYVKTPVDKTTFFIDSSLKFLETERTINVFQREVPPTKKKDAEISKQLEGKCNQKGQINTHSSPEVISNMNEAQQSHQMSEPVVIDTRIDNTGKYPKRYVTTCYLEPRQVPVKYSETMIVKIGSKKKQYFETVYYENKLEPNRWREQMVVRIPEVRSYDHLSEVKIPVQKDNFTPLLQPRTIISEL